LHGNKVVCERDMVSADVWRCWFVIAPF
jgi:hypothetical protein